jgi:hypothetical protein
MAATSFWMEDRVDTTSFGLLESGQQDEERHGRSSLNKIARTHLVDRMKGVLNWIQRLPELGNMPILHSNIAL